jgi:hypothetical protein
LQFLYLFGFKKSNYLSYDEKVDLTAYVEKHEFCFDAVIDENVTNDEVRQLLLKNSNFNLLSFAVMIQFVCCLFIEVILCFSLSLLLI